MQHELLGVEAVLPEQQVVLDQHERRAVRGVQVRSNSWCGNTSRTCRVATARPSQRWTAATHPTAP